MSLRPETLRARLIIAVLVPALLIIALSTVFAFRSADRFAQREQDALLLRTAVAFAAYLEPESGHEAMTVLIRRLHSRGGRLLSAAEGDDLRFLVVDAQGAVLGGDPRLSQVLPRLASTSATRPFFADLRLEGERSRSVAFRHAVRNDDLRIVVAESAGREDAEVRSIVIGSIWPNLLLVIVMIAVVWVGIEGSLRRLDALGRDIARREPTDLEPLDAREAPVEVRPLLVAVNDMLARIDKSNSQQRTFLSGAAHQLRTPLAGIQMQVDLATREAPEELKPRLKRVHAAIGDLVHCTHQMLALARSATGDAADMSPVDLVALIEDSSSGWLDNALSRGAELDFRLSPARCTGSVWMLQQLLGNLIDNAIKHGPGGGLVTIGCGTDPQGRAFVEVEDQGAGIPEAARTQVLEPFVRGPDARSDGSGLGLAIVREVAERHSAVLEFTSGAPHSRVRLTFPAAPPAHGV